MARASWRTRMTGALSLLALVGSGSVVATWPAVAAPVTAGQVAPAAVATSSPGYWLAASDGGIYQFGTTNFGSLRGRALVAPIVGGSATDTGQGYWLVGSDGGVFSFGDARFYGSTGGIRLNRPIVGMATDPATGGYWMVASDGGIFGFHASFFGSTGGIRLNQPIVGMAATPDGGGYWLVARDGGIFAFGDARFYGSTGGIRLNRPIVGMTADPQTGGYWLVASDGGIFSFHAPFFGSTGGIRLVQPIVGMAGVTGGAGYWMVARDGGIFAFGQAPFLGSTGADPGPAPVIGMLFTSDGYPFPLGGLGYDVSQFSCGHLPPPRSFAVVQVSAGTISGSPNPCYAAEAQWAGANLSAYIFLDGLPDPAPPESLTGPAGTCHGNVACESYNFGAYWGAKWAVYSRQVGVNPPMWWLDVESPGVYWSASDLHSNAEVVLGALAAVRANAGVQVGVYSTWYQWPRIVGSLTIPGVPIWAAGADTASGDPASATAFCSDPAQRFGDGLMTLVQYGYAPTQASPYTDPDYACR